MVYECIPSLHKLKTYRFYKRRIKTQLKLCFFLKTLLVSFSFLSHSFPFYFPFYSVCFRPYHLPAVSSLMSLSGRLLALVMYNSTHYRLPTLGISTHLCRIARIPVNGFQTNLQFRIISGAMVNQMCLVTWPTAPLEGQTDMGPAHLARANVHSLGLTRSPIAVGLVRLVMTEVLRLQCQTFTFDFNVWTFCNIVEFPFR